MKKFLSLALALVMSLSLLTVASAAEYKDLTDKSEITYSEAVAVLNKLGIISGYEDGSFKPETALNRAQAAKIICGLLLTQSTADKLTVSSAPYKDVAADYWAAAYISYCKNAGIIDGYSDGTFRPTETLTGYQFGKMLLTALGYDAKTEGFVGKGWTLNVAKVGQAIGLFNGNDAFGGNSEVTREEACLYALNMLKATEVTYDGTNINVSAGDAQVTINNTKAYAVTRIGETDAQAWNKDADGYMQFVEEHFPALKCITTSATADDFERPANAWSYKNVTFGTFAKQPNFVFTAAASGSDDAAKVKNMGLKGYKVAADVFAYVNGEKGIAIDDVEKIPGLTGNGTKVEIYTSDDTAEQITDVVVIKTQLMQINKISKVAKTVSLKQVDKVDETAVGKKIEAVDEDNDCYAELSGMKADDYVLVTYVQNDAGKYVASAVSVPTVVTGKLSKISTGTSGVNGITFAGDAYKLAATRGDCFKNLGTSNINADNDSTLYIDSYGYAAYIDDVTASTNYIVVSTTYKSLVDGKLVNYVQGYDLEGNALNLNLGTLNLTDYTVGDVYAYDTTTANNAEYKIVGEKLASSKQEIKAGDIKYATDAYYADGVKFLFVSVNEDDDVISGVSLKDGVQKVEDTVASVAIKNDKGNVTNVVVIGDESTATGAEVAFVSADTGDAKVGTKAADIYTIYFDGVKTEGVVSTDTGLDGKFVTYVENSDGTFTLKEYKDDTSAKKTTAVLTNVDLAKSAIKNNRYLTAVGTVKELNAANAEIIDLSDNSLGSLADMSDSENGFTSYKVSVVFNGNDSSAGYKTVSYIFINKAA